MLRSSPIRFERGALAVVVLLAHVVLVYLVIETRIHLWNLPEPEPVMATLLDDPRSRHEGLPPVEVQAQAIIPPRVLISALPDVPVEEPEAPAVQPLEVAPAANAPSAGPPDIGAPPGPGGDAGNESRLAVVQRILPKYPPASVHAGEEGSSLLLVRIDPKGHVSEAKVARSAGFKRLDESAIQAVRKWRFTPLVKDGKAVATPAAIEMRFNLYRFQYSRISERPADRLPKEALIGATDVATPGGDTALRRFMDDVAAGNIADTRSGNAQTEIEKMRAALTEWGAVKSIQLSTGGGDREWASYEIKPEYRAGQPRSTVDVKWDMYEVRHEHGTSEWRVALGRDGAVWSAQAGPAPWGR